MPREFVCRSCQETVHSFLRVGETAACPSCGARTEVTEEMPLIPVEPPESLPSPPPDPRERLAKAEAEIEKLKARIVTWKLTIMLAPVLGAAAAIGWLALVGQASFDEIRTRSLRVEEDGSASAIVLRMNDEGEPCLSLVDQDGKSRALLHLDEDSANLSLWPRTGEGALLLGMNADTPSLTLWDSANIARLRLLLTADGNPYLCLRDGSDRTRAEVGVEGGDAHLVLKDAKEKPGVWAHCPEDKAPTLGSRK